MNLQSNAKGLAENSLAAQESGGWTVFRPYIGDMSDFQRIQKLILFLDQNRHRQPGLNELASQIDMSPAHLQRVFTQWAGVSPKAFLKCLTLEHARQLLLAGHSVLDSALESGLSGPSRLHDLCVSLEAASPGEIKSGGAGWRILVGIAESPFGDCLIATSPRGVCHLSFEEDCNVEQAKSKILSDWPNARLEWSDETADRLAQRIFVRQTDQKLAPLKGLVRGTQFQVSVWRALLAIPTGTLASYGKIAKLISRPQSSRAVGTAIGQNHLAYLIPCHRVIRETGVIGQYRWGSARKQAMIAWESASQSNPEHVAHK